MGRFKDLLIDLQRGTYQEPQEPCPRCTRPTRDGYCYYCGTGKPPAHRSAQKRAAAIGRALDLWDEALPITGTAAAHYLVHHRRITVLPPNVNEVLRFHPEGISRIPALVALLRNAVDGHACGIHRTPIARGVGKLGTAKALGAFKGAAIKLWPAPDHGRLLVGEGIETTLSAAQILDLAPAWALGTAYNLGNFPVLVGISELHIAVDNDDVGRGKAMECTMRYRASGRKVYMHIPERHKDFNDILKEAANGEES
jgi:putative DNA primase/helicase